MPMIADERYVATPNYLTKKIGPSGSLLRMAAYSQITSVDVQLDLEALGGR